MMLMFLMGFGQNPTYEDMINFTNALGPAKPPTASQEAVSSTNGVYVIQANNEDGTIQATPLDGATSLRLVASGACPVCLHGYAIGEQVRKIVKCDHMFHRDCVDTVSIQTAVYLIDHWYTELSSSGSLEVATLALSAGVSVLKKKLLKLMAQKTLTALARSAEQSRLDNTSLDGHQSPVKPSLADYYTYNWNHPVSLRLHPTHLHAALQTYSGSAGNLPMVLAISSRCQASSRTQFPFTICLMATTTTFLLLFFYLRPFTMHVTIALHMKMSHEVSRPACMLEWGGGPGGTETRGTSSFSLH